MAQKTHTTAVVLIPPKKLQQPIQAIRRLHDRNFERWMPHITLLYPFALRDEFHKVVPAIDKTAKHVSPISVKFTSFRYFKHRKSSTVYLVPEPADEIINLHASLLQDLPDYNDTNRFASGYTPHLSVGQFEHEAIEESLNRLQSSWKPIHCNFKSISLIYRSPETDDRFVVEENFHFKERS